MGSADVRFSLILPAYNESRRLPSFLAQVRPYLEARFGAACEVIVVDDGSKDDTPGLIARLAADWPRLALIRHPRNLGKGAAVRTGILAAAGDLLLFSDSDGATPIAEEARLADAIAAGADLAVGSRLIAAPGVRRSRRWHRGLAGRLFAAVARRALRLDVRDTQCGFKMFRGDVGRKLFSLAREPRFLFDLEILALAARLGYRIAEVPVRWSEIPGGSFRPAAELPGILLDLVRLRRRLGRAHRRGC